MRITTNTNLISEPIFPTYTFSGTIELTPTIIDSLLTEIKTMKLAVYNWGHSGWNFDANSTWYLTPKISRFAPLVSKQFFDAFTTHYGYETNGDIYVQGNKRYQFEVRRVFPVVLSPGHDFPVQSMLGFYTGITMLQCNSNSHRPYIQDFNTTHKFNDPIRCWIPEQTQQIFIPGSQPWGISSGQDNSNTIALITHFIRSSV